MKNPKKCEQTIMCDVKVCKNNNQSACCCNLSQITVTVDKNDKSAHYCADYTKI